MVYLWRKIQTERQKHKPAATGILILESLNECILYAQPMIVLMGKHAKITPGRQSRELLLYFYPLQIRAS